MATRIKCPRCEIELSVLEGTPKLVSCPRCLAPLAKSGIPRTELPKKAIPLEQEVQTDTNWTLLTLFVLTSLMILGMIIGLVRNNEDLCTSSSMGALLLGFTTFILWAKSDAESRGLYFNEKPKPPVQHTPSGAVLEYEPAPAKGSAIARGCGLILMVVGGIVLLLFGLCVAAALVGSAGAVLSGR